MKERETNFSILNKTKIKKMLVSSAFLTQIKDYYLKDNYELSLVYLNNKQSKKLNLLHRGKNKPANILSFPLSKNIGEIFIDLEELKKQAPSFELSEKNFFLKLFIHGLCHLKGMDHSSKMDRTEEKIQKHFGLNF